MNERGPEFPISDPRFAIIGMANMFFGVDYSNDEKGYDEAIASLELQSNRSHSDFIDGLTLVEVVANQSPVIEFSEQMAMMALEDEDFATAIFAANDLFKFGEVDFQDSLGGKAYQLSLRTHWFFVEKIMEKFSSTDPYLRVAGNQILNEARGLRDQGDLHKSLGLIRGVIHVTALNGTLGDLAKAKFDPYAIIQKV